MLVTLIAILCKSSQLRLEKGCSPMARIMIGLQVRHRQLHSEARQLSGGSILKSP
jgi:hypothetical protein